MVPESAVHTEPAPKAIPFGVEPAASTADTWLVAGLIRSTAES